MAKRITLEEILPLHRQGKSNKFIAKTLNRDPHAIGNFLKRNNLLPHVSGRDFIKVKDLDILIGTLLGDSSLKYGSAKYPCLSFNHASSQRKYFFHKTKVFSYLSNKVVYNPVKQTSAFGEIEVYSYTSKYLKSLEELEKIFYVNRKKIIPLEYLEKHFTERSLAYLFMDDGNINGKTVNLNLQSFTEEEQRRFIKFLEEKFNLKFTLQKNRNYFRLYLKQESVLNFINIVSPYVIKSMQYKIPMSSLNSVNLGNP